MRSFKRHPLALAVLALACTPSSLLFAQQVAPTTLPNTLPQGLQVVAGQVRTQQQGSQLTVSNSPGAVLNWQSFSVGSAARVHFEQAGAASKVLNRVTGHDPSAIFGSLTSNGQVWLLNPNGVLFGAGARVDVAGLVASTLRLNDNDFLAGRYRFNALAGDAGTVRNEGRLRTSLGGQVVLLGERVANSGSVEAGSVSVAAARSVELVDTSTPNLVVRVDVPAGEVLNLGRLVAGNGSVDVMGAIVNQQGLVAADTLGTDAQGRIVLRASDTLTLAEGSTTRAAAIDLLGERVALTGNARVDASTAAGGGNVRIGGGLMGQDTSVPNARAVFIGPQASVRADATGERGESGHGGSIIVWSDEATRAYGSFSARGGGSAGRGGFIETSGGWIDARPANVDVRGAGGAGTWLIDPNNILINNAGPNTNITGTATFTTTGDSAVISTATIAAALNAGNSVTITTASAGANSQAGDILMDNATLAVAPGSAVGLTMNAARDIVIRDSTITSSGAALSLTLNTAGSGIGAAEILRSTITTAGGSVTLQGTNSRQLTLPDGTLTAPLRPAVGYLGSSPPSITSNGGRVGVNVEGSVLNLGGGTFRAVGTTPVDNSDGVRIGSSSGATTTINAATIDLYGHSFVTNRVNIDVGTMIQGDATALNATAAFTIEGSGSAGVSIEAGARLTLSAAPASGATLRITGRGGFDHGVSLFADDVDTGTAGRGTRLVATNAGLAVVADSTQNTALTMTNDAGAPGPLLDLSGATGATFTVTRSAAGTFGPVSTLIRDVDLLLPTGGTTTFAGDLGIELRQVFATGSGSTLNLSGSNVAVNNSLLNTSSGTLALNFATTGATPRGVSLLNTIIDTGGGDVTFGASQILPAGVLPATNVAAPWVRASGSGSAEALELNNTAIDAGTGRIVGGGASTSSSSASGGVALIDSNLSAREINLAGRSDGETGLLVSASTLAADRVLRLDGLSAGNAGNSGAGLVVAATSTLQVLDPNTTAGSQMVLSGNNRAGYIGTVLLGGSVGSGTETRLNVSGAALTVTGITSGGSTGLAMAGNAAAPGGLFFNAIGATAVTLQGGTDSGVGTGLSLQYANLQGPQAAASATQLIGNGVDGNGGPGTRVDSSTIGVGGTLLVLGDGVVLSNSRIVGENGVRLHANTGATAPAGGVPVIVSGSTISTSGAGAELRIEGSNNDAARGSLASVGTGVSLIDTTLSGSGSGSSIVINGQGAAAGGSGVTFARVPMTATTITITGRGIVTGDGVFGEDLTGSTLSLLSATNLTISGTGANAAPPLTRVGVRLGRNVELALDANRGNLLISGDTVVLGDPSGGTPAFRATGDAAAFTVASDGSLRIVNATLDFTGGGGTTVQLVADNDASGAGRARVENSSIRTGGAAFSASGVGVSSLNTQGQGVPGNTTASDGASGVLLTGTTSIEASTITLTGLAAPGSATLQPGGWGVNIGGTSTLTANTVSIDGRATNAGAGVEIGTAAANTTLTVNAGVLSVVGQAAGSATPGVSIVGVGSLNSGSGDSTITSLAGDLVLDGTSVTGNNITLTSPAGLDLGSGSTRLTAVRTAALVLTDVSSLGLDNNSGPSFNALFSGMSSTSTVLVQAPNTSGLAISAPLSVPGQLVFEVPVLSLLRGGSLAASAVGDAIVLRGAAGLGIESLNNVAGGGALATPNGRWVLLLDDPGASTLGALPYAFSAYDLGTAPWSFDGSGNYITPAAGNALGYTVSAASVSGNSLAGTQGKVYDASTAITLSPATWSLSGLVAGDTLAIAGNTSGTMNDKNVGTGKAVSAPGAVFSVSDAQGRPVFGYAAPVFTATVTPALLAVSGTAAADRAYDATTGALLANLGGVSPLPGDVVFVAGGSGSFSDKNVGSNKAVTLSGFTLGGADAGNYQAVLPTGLTASITPLALPLAGLTAGSKVYDATTAATLSGTAQINPLAGDTVVLAGTGTGSGSFGDKNVGTNKPVLVSGFSISGTDAGNYTLVTPASLTANITPLALPVTGLSAASRMYNATTAAPLAGTAAIAPLAGDAVTLAGTATGTFANANVGNGKAVVVSGLTLAGADAGNYSLVAPTGLTAAVTPATLTITGLVAAGKTYDATTAASLAGALTGVLGGDTVSLSLSGSFASANVAASAAVNWSALLGGTSAANYQLAQATGSTSAAITPATLTYVAAPATGTAGQAPPPLTGSVTGLLGSDTLASSTTGTLLWSTTATAASLAGSYPITGGGLSALNYAFVQAPGNSTALSLQQPSTSDPGTTATTVVTTQAIAAVQIPVAMSTPTQGRVLDSTPAFSIGSGSGGGVAYRASSTLTLNSSGQLVAVSGVGGPSSSGFAGAPGTTPGSGPPGTPTTAGTPAAAAPGVLPAASSVAAALAAQSAAEAGGLTFEALDWSRLPRDEVQTLLAARARYKQKVFERSVYSLQQDPALADVQPCKSEAELDSGRCTITEALKREIQAARERQRQQPAASADPARQQRTGPRVLQAGLPAIERKLALLIGVNTYKDKRVPELRGAVPDTQAVRNILEGRMGYETTVLANPGREEIVRAFNRLALQAEANDSVIIYYAGHGVLVDINGQDTGFWLPSDVDAELPASWLSNADIARLVAAVGAKQLMLVSDSCYSGQLVGKERVSLSENNADELLKRKAAIVMSSGGDEPVADEGKNRHSVFAWHFMRALEAIQGEREWQPGNSLFDRVKSAVQREFPQTPQYGASRSAGHQGNTDYLWERRQLETLQTQPQRRAP
jgi:filamentous hemagglutinin family protein